MSLRILVLSLCAGAAAAQLPADSFFTVSGFANTTTGRAGGLVHVDPVGNTSIPLTGAFCRDLNAVLVDPGTGDFFAAGISVTGGGCPGDGLVRRLTVSGHQVVAETVLAALPGGSVNGLALDPDGNVIASQFSPSTGGTLWRIDRRTGSALPLNAVPFPAGVNAITGSQEFYVAVTGPTSSSPSTIYRVDLDGSIEQVATTSGLVTGNQFISGLALGAEGRELWVTGFGNPSVVVFDLTANGGRPPHPGRAMPLIPQSLNAIAWDVDRAGFWLTSAGAVPNGLWFVDPATNPPTVTGVSSFPTLPFGVPSGITLPPARNTLDVFPRVIQVGRSATMELAVHGRPGDTGYVGITQIGQTPVLALLGSGPIGSNGALVLPSLPLPPLPPELSGLTVRFGFAVAAPGSLHFAPAGAAVKVADKHEDTIVVDDDPSTQYKYPVFKPDGFQQPPGTRLKIRNAGPAVVVLQEYRELQNEWIDFTRLSATDPQSLIIGNGGSSNFKWRVKLVDPDPHTRTASATFFMNID